MLYQREIEDSVLIQFIILYTLDNADAPLPYNQLVTLILENCNINFNDFQIALNNLLETNHIKNYIKSGHNQIYEITQKGNQVADFFAKQVPIYIREPIAESIKQLFIDERRRNAIHGEILPIRRDEYAAECTLKDDDKTYLMKLELFAGPREEAEKLAVYFREHSAEVYERIIKAFQDDEDNTKSDN